MNNQVKNRIIIVLFLTLMFINAFIIHNQFYLYFIRPFSLLIVSIVAYLLLNDHRPRKMKTASDIQTWSIIIPLIYLLVYYVLGYFTGFSQNPYNNSVNGIIMNIITFGSLIVGMEYIRSIVIGTSKGRTLTINYVIIVIIFTIFEINFKINYKDGFEVFKLISCLLIPLILENTALNYVALKGGFFSSLIYKILIRSFVWIVPIIPNFEWIVEAIFDYLVPFFLLIISIQLVDKKNRQIDKQELEKTDPKKMIPTIIVVIIIMLFAIGALPLRPVAILSDSMKNDFSKGDIVIIEKISYDNIIVGDVIQYVRNDFTVVHRVIEVVNRENELPHLITKGDNNIGLDPDPVYENQVLGRVVFSIPKLGLPAYWLNNAINNVNVDIETGMN